MICLRKWSLHQPFVLADTEWLLCPSSFWQSSVWNGDFFFFFNSAALFASSTITLSTAGPRFSHPHSSWQTENNTVCCQAVVSCECCDGNVHRKEECSTQTLDLQKSPCWRKSRPTESGVTSLLNDEWESVVRKADIPPDLEWQKCLFLLQR